MPPAPTRADGLRGASDQLGEHEGNGDGQRYEGSEHGRGALAVADDRCEPGDSARYAADNAERRASGHDRCGEHEREEGDGKAYGPPAETRCRQSGDPRSVLDRRSRVFSSNTHVVSSLSRRASRSTVREASGSPRIANFGRLLEPSASFAAARHDGTWASLTFICSNDSLS